MEKMYREKYAYKTINVINIELVKNHNKTTNKNIMKCNTLKTK